MVIRVCTHLKLGRSGRSPSSCRAYAVHGLVAKMKRKLICHARMRRLFNAEADRIGCCPDSQDGSIWVADITQVNTAKNPFFLAAVMDKFTWENER